MKQVFNMTIEHELTQDAVNDIIRKILVLACNEGVTRIDIDDFGATTIIVDPDKE